MDLEKSTEWRRIQLLSVFSYHILLAVYRSFHKLFDRMPGSNGADDYHSFYSSPRPSPALSTMQLPNLLSAAPPFSSNSGFSDLHDMTSSPFSATIKSVSLWQDKTDMFSNRQKNVSNASNLPGEGLPSTSATPVLYPRDIDSQLGQYNSDEIYVPGRTPRGLMRDLYPSRFPVHEDLTRYNYAFSCYHGILLLQNSTMNISPAQILANATHDQLRQSGNLAYIQLYNASTKAQSEADTIR